MSRRRRLPIRGLLIAAIVAGGLAASIAVLVVVLIAVEPSLQRDEVDRQARELRGQVAAAAQANRLREPITPAEAVRLARGVQQEVGGEVRVTYRTRPGAPDRIVELPDEPSLLPLFTSAGQSAFTLLDGPERRAVASRSPIYAGGDAGSLTRIGTLTVAQRTTGTSPALERAQRAALIAAGIIVLLAVGVGWLLARLIGNPAVRLSRTARELADGDLTARSPGGGPREIDSLATDFNVMADRLEDLVGELTGERDRANAMIGSLSEGVVAIDQRGRIVLANDAARDFLALGDEQIAGAPLPASVRDLAGITTEQVLGLPDGRMAAVLALPITRDPSGGTVITIRDVTSEQRLAQARRDLVANASHELKTPLTGIRGLQELIAAGDHEPDEQAELIDLIGVEVGRLERLVAEQLELARLDAGEMGIERAPVDLAVLAEQAIAPKRPVAHERGIILGTAPPADGTDTMALADAPRIEQVILILVDNALGHTPPGGRVTVAVGGDDRWARIVVRDTGEGIPAADLPMVFDRFYRRDDARTRPGTGLGLAIARGIVQAHDGSIEVESAPGAGCAFTVSLPRPPFPER